MKKLLLLFIISLSTFTIVDAAVVKTSLVKEDFESAVAPWGFSTASQLTTSITTAKTPYTGNALQWAFTAASGSRTSTKQLNGGSILTNPADGIIKLDFKWYLGTPTSKNTSGIFLRFKDNSGNISIAFSTESTQGPTGNALHYVNLDNTVTNDATASTTRIVPSGDNFIRESWVSIHVSLNFNTHTVDTLTITNASGTATYAKIGQPFYSSSATGLATVELYANRDGANMGWTGQLDDFSIYYFKAVTETGSVTINYKDQLGNILKTSRVQTDVEVGTTYTATANDKITFKDASNYYIYDAASSTDNVIVASGGSVIDLHFKVVPITSGTYTWTGTTNGNWDDLYTNFTTDGSNNLGYQPGNALVFPEVTTTKTVTLGKSFDLGAGNMTINADGYTFTGTGSLSGTGTMFSNPGATGTTNLGIVNGLTGGVNVQSGTLKINVADAGASFTMADGTTLNVNSGANFSKAITGTGTMTFIPASNVTYSSTISGLSGINYVLTSAGAASTSGAFSLLPTLNNTFDGAINVSTSLSSSSMYGSTNNFTNNVLTLGDNVAMVYPINPASDGTTAIAIGELSGTSLSKLMGPRLRTVNYNIGGLNTNSTFAGTVENFPADNWSNIPVINISKVGTGVLTLTGTSSGYVAGTISASAGTLIVNGQLGTTAVPATVATGATLKGTGTIGGATTVNGTLEGSMNFGSTLTLAGTTKINVSGFNAGDYDQIKVTGALTNGGVLNINITSDPTGTGTIQLINAGSYSGTFTSVNIVSPSHPAPAPAQNRVSSANYATITYSYDASTGILSYTDVPTNVNTLHSDLQIYPTLSKGNVYVNAENVNSISVVSMSGQLMQQVNSTGNRTTVNLNGLSNGSYILNVKFNDGLNKTQSVILQK